MGGRSESDDAQDFPFVHAADDKFAARRIGPVSRQFPVAVADVAPVRGRISMAGQADLVRHLVEHDADRMQYVARVRLQLGLGHRKHRAILLVDDLYPQSFAGNIEQQLLLEFPQSRIGIDRGVDFSLQHSQARALLTFEFFLGRLQIGRLPGLGVRAFLDLAFLARQIGAAAHQDRRTVAAAGTARHRHFQRRLEVLGNAAQVTLRGRSEQPHQQEERHHRRHEVGIGDLPGAAAMAAAAHFLDALDYNRPQPFIRHRKS